MKVLGISGSGRKQGYSAMAVQDVLSAITVEQEYLSLSGLQINGCLGCLKCASSNVCIQKDDFQFVLDKVLESDVLIFAGPNYYGTLGALAASFWERTFCLRHQEVFPLAGKMGVAIGFDRSESAPAKNHIIRMMQSNKMAVIESFSDPGHYQCYDCGYGHECVVGNVYPRQGLCSKETAEDNRPKEYAQKDASRSHVKAIGKLINSIVVSRK